MTGAAEAGSGEIAAVAARLRAGDRATLARAITLSESTRREDRQRAQALLAAIWPDAGNALRLAITGPPGVGKSTLIEALGLHMVGAGRRLAVLAVDPSSSRGGGAILGDKTRMARLAAHPLAYIRPSPATRGGGGVARRTREAIAFAEAAGHDVVIVETVGAGQGEAAVAGMSDVFLLLVAPGGGDELQGIKRGVMELADLVLVNKADGDLAAAARSTLAAHAAALGLLRRRASDPAGIPRALAISAREETGIDTVWQSVQALDQWRREAGHWREGRRRQVEDWVRDAIEEAVLARAAAPGGGFPDHLAERILSGAVDPERAAADMLARRPG